jgi:hypothetical protein
MCCYLYAAFSLKHPGEGGLSADESAAAGRWRSMIMGVAIEEMTHSHTLGVIAGLVPATQITLAPRVPNRDPRDKPAGDTCGVASAVRQFHRQPLWRSDQTPIP